MKSKLLYNNQLIEVFHEDLQSWYFANKRNLPWRGETDFYHIWISEIILQQTRVNQGLDYYNKFIKKFPNVAALAIADEDEVLKLWEGLGYYSRARNLHNGAKQIVALGNFPQNYNNWLKIKGVGPYTAAAISSIVKNESRAVVDGNVQRVLSRLLKYSTAVNTHLGMKELSGFANILLNRKNAGDYNQAVMELGARVCKPKNPDCENCCLADLCEAYKDGVALSLPVKEKKVKIEKRFLHFYVFKKNDAVLLQRRGKNNIWAGLYQFPLIETPSLKSVPNPVKPEWLAKNEIGNLRLLWQGKHQLTHRTLQIFCWQLINDITLEPQIENAEWFKISDLNQLAFPRPLRKIIDEFIELQ